MGYDVFLSYSVQDKTSANAVCARLEERGIRCWIAPRDIPLGTDWAASIIDAMNQVRAMVLILTASSNVSPQVQREVDRAVSKGLVVIPMRLDEIELSSTLEYYLSAQHWLDAVTPPLERHIDRLGDTLDAVLGRTSEAAAPAAAPTAAPPLPARPLPRTSRRRWILGASLALALIAVGLAVNLLLRPKPPHGEVPVLRVATVESLLRAIGSNRIVELASGEYDLTGATEISSAHVQWHVAQEWTPLSKEMELVIAGVENLTIRAGEGERPHVFTSHPYAYVVRLEGARSTTLAGLLLGHYPEPAGCMAGVVHIVNGRDVVLADCELYGSGAEGLTVRDTARLRVFRSTITECTSGILTVSGSEDVTFEQSVFRGNGQYYGLSFPASRRVRFVDCTISGNRIREPLFSADATAGGDRDLLIEITGGVIAGNTAARLAENWDAVRLEGTEVMDNEWLGE